jgi:hypothetical protein
VTYLATVPVVALSIVALLRCREPQLHRASERVSFGRQLGTTLGALTRRRGLWPVVALTALTAVSAQVIFEFGPLWLVDLHAPTALYGPYWAGVVSTIGVGAWLAGRIHLERRGPAAILAAVLAGAALLPETSHSLTVVIAAHLLIALAAATIGVRAGYLLHEAVPAAVRAGVSSGASTLAWLVFVPVSLLFGWLTTGHGVQTAGWLLAGLGVGAGVLLVRTAGRPHLTADPAAGAVPVESGLEPAAPMMV